jgi:hypothetical protein
VHSLAYVVTTETKWVCRAVLTESLTITPVTAEAWVRVQVSPCKIFGGQSGTGYVFLQVLRSPLSVSQYQCSKPLLIFICILFLPEGQIGEAWKPSIKQGSFANQEAVVRRVLSEIP